MVLTPSNMLPLGTPLPVFQLQDTLTGRLVGSADFSGRPLLVAVICNHCPYVRHIAHGIAELGQYCATHNVAMVAVSANDPVSHPGDGPAQMARQAEVWRFTFPYLFDAEQTFVRDLRAACTPEFYLFDRNQRLAYRGQMDGARPNNDLPNDGADLRAAIDCVCQDRAPSAAQTPSIGCNIKWKPGNQPVDLLR
jgi:hypothetical protein